MLWPISRNFQSISDLLPEIFWRFFDKIPEISGPFFDLSVQKVPANLFCPICPLPLDLVTSVQADMFMIYFYKLKNTDIKSALTNGRCKEKGVSLL